MYGWVAAICIRSANCLGYGRLGERTLEELLGLFVMVTVIEGELCLDSVSIIGVSKGRRKGLDAMIRWYKVQV